MNKDILQFAMDQSGLDDQQFNQQSTSSLATQPRKLTSSDVQPIVVNGQVYYKTPTDIFQLKPNNVIQKVSKFEFELQLQAEQARRLLNMQNIFNNGQSVSVIHNQLNNIAFHNQFLNSTTEFARNRSNNFYTFNPTPDTFRFLNQQLDTQNDQQNQKPLIDINQIFKDTISSNVQKRSKGANFNEIFAQIANEREIDDEDNVQGETYADYMPSKLKIGIRHPDPVVETSSLSSVLPPDVTYDLGLPEELIDSGLLSALQLESITYACQQHEQILPDGNRAGFLIGDGAGVGKGRTIAGIIYENYLQGRKKAIWLSISADLKYDSERDLNDIGASRIKVYALNKLKYGKLSSGDNKIKKGVIFSTYSSLISKSSNVRGKCGSRLGQLLDWCGEDFDGIIVFDECHKAKNLIPSAGKRGNETKATKTAETVVELQKKLPNARIVYASATGASEPKNLAYMVRLGLWGVGTSFSDFRLFMDTINKHGVGGMEMTAIDMKQRGLYMARQLSFKGVEFEIRDVNLTDIDISTYNECTDLWVETKVRIEQALGLMMADTATSKQIWNQFWSSHQRFFKYLCIAAKVPEIVRVAKEELKNGNAVVIGLQSTGEARINEALEESNGDLTDFVSTAKAVYTSFIEKHFPAPNESKSLKILGLTKIETEESDYNNRSARKAREQTNSRLEKQRQADRDFINDDSDDTISDSETDDSATDVDQDDSFELTDKSNDKKSDNDDDSTEEDISDIEDSDDYISDESDELESGDEEDESDFDSDVEPWEKYNNNAKSNKRSKNKKSGKKKKKKLTSSSGSANERCVQFKNSLLDKIEKLSIKLPKNTIDELIHELGGPEEVAELTGRKGRMVSNVDGVTYELRKELDIPLDQLNIAEKERFMNDEKQIAIISDAASSGISLQSDKRAKNKKRRVHITIELPWSADKAIQQFGRTHRSNQANAPKYIFMISKLAGEQRFAASVAKRLQSLGALLFGDRRATDTRDLSRFNFDPKYSKEALKTVLDVILGMENSPIEVTDYEDGDFFKDCREAMVGVGLIDFDKSMRSYILDNKKEITVDRFLNRLLGMKVNLQNALFKYFSDIMDVYIKHAKRMGKYDKGILEYKSDTGQIDLLDKNEYQFKSGNLMTKVELHKISVNRGIEFETALEMIENSTDINEGFYETRQEHFVRKSVWLAVCDSSTHYRNIYRLYKPNIGQENSINSISDLKSKGKKIDTDKAREYWNDIYNKSESLCYHKLYHDKCSRKENCDDGKRKKEVHILSGSILALWSTIERVLGTDTKLQIVRISSPEENGLRFIGVEIPEKSVNNLKLKLEELSKTPPETNKDTELNQSMKTVYDEDTNDSDIFISV